MYRKLAALVLAAALLCSSPVTIHRAPRLTDVDHMLRVLTDCGARIGGKRGRAAGA